jgi:hypothetical protein
MQSLSWRHHRLFRAAARELQCHSLATVALRLTRPLTSHALCFDGSIKLSAGELLMDCLRRDDWMGLLQHREIVTDGSAHPAAQPLARLVEAYTATAGFNEIISWLLDLQETVDAGDFDYTFQRLAMLAPEVEPNCCCVLSDSPVAWYDNATFTVLHREHRMVNRATWEILASRPGCIEAVRRFLDQDVHCWTMRGEAAEELTALSQDGAQLLLDNLVCAEPNLDWVGCRHFVLARAHPRRCADLFLRIRKRSPAASSCQVHLR